MAEVLHQPSGLRWLNECGRITSRRANSTKRSSACQLELKSSTNHCVGLPNWVFTRQLRAATHCLRPLAVMLQSMQHATLVTRRAHLSQAANWCWAANCWIRRFSVLSVWISFLAGPDVLLRQLATSQLDLTWMRILRHFVNIATKCSTLSTSWKSHKPSRDEANLTCMRIRIF